MRGRQPAAVAVVSAVSVLAACATGGVSEPGAERELTIYAAASLTDAIEALRTAYAADRPGTTLTVSTGASSALRAQIEQGAPADVFLAADEHHPQALADAGLAHDDVVPFAATSLTVVVPARNAAGIATPRDLADADVTIIAAGAEVPITRYADEVVANLADLPGYPADFAARYASNVASREDDVRAVVAKIALGEGDAGIVYVTDATVADGVATVDIPVEANVRATYAAVVVGGSDDPAAAGDFVEWLAGRTAKGVLADLGFKPP